MIFEVGLTRNSCRDLIAIFFAIAIFRIAWLAVKSADAEADDITATDARFQSSE